jgi:hypothetical protein
MRFFVNNATKPVKNSNPKGQKVAICRFCEKHSWYEKYDLSYKYAGGA